MRSYVVTAVGIALAEIVLVTAGCSKVEQAAAPVQQETTRPDQSARLAEMFEAYWQEVLELNPDRALAIGDYRFLDRYNENLTDAYAEATRVHTRKYLEQLAQFDPATLGERDQDSHRMLKYELEEQQRAFSPEIYGFTVKLPVMQFSSFHNAFADDASGNSTYPFRNVDDYEKALKRADGFARHMDMAIQRMKEGMAAGIVQPRVLMQRVLPQLEAHIAPKPQDTVFYKPVLSFPKEIGTADRERLAAAYREHIANVIQPAYRRLRDFIAREYLPKTRASSGIDALPNGKAVYDFLSAALFHDVGNVVERDRHHIISQETVEKLAASGQIPFGLNEAALVGLLCRWHRKAYEPERCDELHGETIRTGLLASILRVADALDSDYRRFDYPDKFMRVLTFFYPHELYFWQGLAEILGIRLHCTPEVQLQVFVQPQTPVEENYHIRALRKDVADTPLAWPIQIIKCRVQNTETAPLRTPFSALSIPHAALVVAPFDPHSLVMAALSRKHLLAAGYQVELLIYPDTEGATAWLWQSALADFTPSDFGQLVVIGDRPDSTSEAAQLSTLGTWQAQQVQCTVLNRHEANWTRLPALLNLGVQVSLGGDWAFFWGETADEADLFWGRIAAFCTRDPIQSTLGLTVEEATITQGLLAAVYQHIQSSASNEDWVARALPILEQIGKDERSWFAAQAPKFAIYTTLPAPFQVIGKVLRVELPADSATSTLFWGLEAAIETQGRRAERGIVFTTPYAIATWVPAESNDQIELLAINHWREEEATPIRLLYPSDLGPAPEGNESAIRVRLSPAQAERIVPVLITACNQL